MHLAVGHARHAVRRPAGLRLRRSLRPAGARRRPDVVDRGGLGRRRHHDAARRAERRRLEVLRRLPAEAAAEEGRGAAGPAARRGSAAEPDVHRVHGRLQHLVHPGVLRAGNRHHPHAAGRHARLRAVPARHRRSRPDARTASTSSTTARRSSTSAPSRCASTSRRSFPHIYLYTSTNGLAFTEAQARRLVHSGIDEVTFSIDGATQATLRTVPPARQVRRRDQQPAGDGRREDGGRARRAVSELALHPVHVERQRRGDGPGAARSRPTSASTGCAGSSPTIPRTRSHGGSCQDSAALEAIRRETWDNNNLGNAIPGATPRARIDVRSLLPGLPLLARAGQPLPREGARAATSRPAPFPPRPATAAGSSVSAPSSVTPDGTLINRDFARGELREALPGGDIHRHPRHAARPSRRPESTRSSSIWSTRAWTGSSGAARKRRRRRCAIRYGAGPRFRVSGLRSQRFCGLRLRT